jgi:pimeloyl-ACP methyl ester carboxylesterase
VNPEHRLAELRAVRSDIVTTWLNTPIQMQFRVIDGLTVRFAESEDRRDQALLLSPWPESLLAFEPMWARLAGHAHLVAVDLPGFGHSERRDALLSPAAMGEFVVRAADAFGLDSPHVVGPDIGTAAGLFAAASYPGRLRSLVVGSAGAAVPLQLGSVLKDWVTAPDLEEFRGADPRQIVAVALSGIERYALPDPVREDYLSSYDDDRFVESMRYVRAYPAELPTLRDLLPQIQTPVQIIAGARDPAVPPVNAEFPMTGCPTASSTSSTRGTSRGRTQRTSTPRSSPAGGAEATGSPDRGPPADRDRKETAATLPPTGSTARWGRCWRSTRSCPAGSTSSSSASRSASDRSRLRYRLVNVASHLAESAAPRFCWH